MKIINSSLKNSQDNYRGTLIDNFLCKLTNNFVEATAGILVSNTLLKIIKGTHVRNVISGLPYMSHFMHSVCQ